ncbi:hypothetical protein AMECASPLE_033205 [Ameca splendens]|uniref:Uncharacterized protein n=1 Tax=Ameca splendens TaxID=208324 RepID=A0ABV0Y743_9TELE
MVNAMLEGLCLSAGLDMPQASPREDGRDVWGEEEKRGSPEGLWFVPAAAYTGLMRSLREGVRVSVYVCVCLFVSAPV